MAQEASKPAPEPYRPRIWPMFDRLFLIDFWLIFDPFSIDFSLHVKVKKNKRFNIKKQKKRAQQVKRLTPKRGGGYAALLRVG